MLIEETTLVLFMLNCGTMISNFKLPFADDMVFHFLYHSSPPDGNKIRIN